LLTGLIIGYIGSPSAGFLLASLVAFVGHFCFTIGAFYDSTNLLIGGRG
jgi:hypothetical protein